MSCNTLETLLYHATAGMIYVMINLWVAYVSK